LRLCGFSFGFEIRHFVWMQDASAKARRAPSAQSSSKSRNVSDIDANAAHAIRTNYAGALIEALSRRKTRRTGYHEDSHLQPARAIDRWQGRRACPDGTLFRCSTALRFVSHAVR
jgi:hypothetical protein